MPTRTVNDPGAPVFCLSFDKGTLVFKGDGGISPPEMFKKIEFKYDDRSLEWRCDAIYYHAVRKQADALGIRWRDEVTKWCAVSWPNPLLPELRKEQKEAVEAWKKTRQGLIVMPTGTGKTEVALSIMRDLQVSALVVAPVRDLMYQWQRRILGGLGYDAGVIGDNIHDVRSVSVTTYHSAYIHMDKLGHLYGLIIFDECHHLPGLNRREAALMSAAPYRMGLTATPERSDGLEDDLDWLIGPTVYNLDMADVKGKTLADYDTFRIPVHLLPREQEVFSRCGKVIREFIRDRKKDKEDYSWLDLMKETGRDPAAREAQQAFYARKSIEDRAAEKIRVLEDLFRLHYGAPAIIFAGSNAMARDISKRFLIPCLLNHCGKRERADILEGLREGRYPALVANQVLDEGVDLPEVKVAVVLGGKGSTRQAKQRLGRILRKSGNKRGILYEVVTDETGEVARSRRRRKSDAYEGTRHRRI